MRRWSSLWLALAVCPLAGGPREFGLAEFHAALAWRGLKPEQFRLRYEISNDPPETWRIEATRISGGDLRGLMYGLLEAAEQVRSTGRLVLAKGEPATAVRAVRVEVGKGLTAEENTGWRPFLEMLARNRFNLLHLVTQQPEQHVEFLKAVEQMAAEYAIEVKPRTWRPQLPEAAAIGPVLEFALLEELDRLPWGDPVRVRRTVALARIENQSGYEIEARFPADRQWLYYMVWGRLGYDPKLPEKRLLAEFERRFGQGAAAEVMEAHTAASQAVSIEASPGRFVASAKEGVRSRLERSPSAKRTPLDQAHLIYGEALKASRALDQAGRKLTTNHPGWAAAQADLRRLVSLARFQARRLTVEDFAEMFRQTGNDSALQAARRGANRLKEAAAELQLDYSAPELDGDSQAALAPLHYPRSLPKPELEHLAPRKAWRGQPLTLTLRVTPAGGARLVRLHYRSGDGEFRTIEAPPARASFQVTPEASLVYYFEILNKENTGWFEPDPDGPLPYFHVTTEERASAPAQP